MNVKKQPIRFRKLASGTQHPGLIIWFPHAGGTSGSMIRQTSNSSIDMQTWVAVLPGREERWDETANDLHDLVLEFDKALDEQTNEPLILAGHSFGGLLAYLISERRCRRGVPPQALVAMAVAPPDRLESESWSGAEDHELVDYLDRKYGAIPAGLRENHQLLQGFLPVVRHDLRLMESYQHKPTEPLPINLFVCGGMDDRQLPEKSLADWQRFTRSKFTLKMFEGGHFFPYPQIEAITQIIASEV